LATECNIGEANVSDPRNMQAGNALPYSSGRPVDSPLRSQHRALALLLKEYFDEVADEPLPDRIVDLLRRLDTSGAASLTAFHR
jgi:hypothetical protein